MSDLLDLAQGVLAQARAKGADQVTVHVSEGTHSQIQRRAGRVEQASEAVTRGLSLSLLVNDRFSSHSTSDLRPEAVARFLDAAVAATRLLEPDPDRALPPAERCGRGVSDAALEQLDPAWAARTASDRGNDAAELERAVDALADSRVISSTVQVADGFSRSARVTSDGFADETEEAWFSTGAETTLRDDDGRRPEAYTYYGARYLADMPGPEALAEELFERARERLGSAPAPSGSYPLVLSNRAAGRILGMLGGPLAGSALHEHRSCLAGRLGQRIASPKLTLIDDPFVPRGLGSRPWDGDGLRAERRTIVEEGVLRSFYINVYYARKLGVEPTTGGRSNWVVAPGDQPWKEVAAAFPKAIFVDGFLGGNANATTGDFSYGIRGQLLEHGAPVASISEMNVAGNLIGLLERLAAVGDDPWKWSSAICPTLIFEDVQFSGT